ncbi:Concanavalin A-like lectin/glucanases superfamily [Corchorus olitorius]|uniref:Concanavalin A-like lectin/glucanases superfamily n=1 Tax=Corchorus olitorius TaxID=93759 RepID=A0A1R3IM90_9ROSI|nr:Concanavalin A-like lectin/glucanases superfamily [Corchorus olitorius]
MATALVISFASILLINLVSCSEPTDPTKGFRELPLTASNNFRHDKPYDVPVTQRYHFRVDHGVHRLWVYSRPIDKPFQEGSTTLPRSEIRIQGYNYSSGVWQFEGYGYVPSRNGTSGVCIMQVLGASSHATTFMLRVYKGSLYYYRKGPIEKNIYDRWFKLNVIHDVDASKLKVYIDGVLKLEAPGRGGDNHYFKFGVYSQDDASHYMESRWKHIKILKKD